MSGLNCVHGARYFDTRDSLHGVSPGLFRTGHWFRSRSRDQKDQVTYFIGNFRKIHRSRKELCEFWRKFRLL